MLIRARNWQEFQHYDKRRPPWIKFHRSLLDNYQFQCLPIASRALAPMLWLIASESDHGEVDATLTVLAFRLRQSEGAILEALKPLIDSGFFECLQDASGVLASVEVSEHQEERRGRGEVEERVTTSLVNGCAVDGMVLGTNTESQTTSEPPLKLVKNGIPPCDYQAVAEAYHEHLPMLPSIVGLSRTRRDHINARWREVCAADGITSRDAAVEFFRDYFAKVARSKFLLGQASAKPGARAFRANFDWLLLPTNFMKVVEGNYDERKAL